MKFEELLSLVHDQPLFETGLLLAGDRDPDDVRRQLSRWVSAGRVHQFRRGLYALASPYRKLAPHPFQVANGLVPGSYVSGYSALAFYSLIPEYVARTTSVTSAHPWLWDGYQFQHIAASLFFGYQSVELPHSQHAFVATPEKALLDLAHFTTGSDSPAYLQQLRLQNLEQLDIKRLNDFAQRAQKPKWQRVARQIAILIADDSQIYQDLP